MNPHNTPTLTQPIQTTFPQETPINPPQSQAIRANGQIFVSSQIPADSSANLVQGNIGELTQACCDNIKAILDAAGSDVSKIVKVNVRARNNSNQAVRNQYAGSGADM